jgi:hypothetical protein
VPAQEKEVYVTGFVQATLLFGEAVELTEEQVAAQAFLEYIGVDHTESEVTDTGSVTFDLFMKHEGNLIQDWNNIEDVLSIHITLAMYDPTKPTPDNQERFTESVGNTHFDSSWVTGYDEVFPSVEFFQWCRMGSSDSNKFFIRSYINENFTKRTLGRIPIRLLPTSRYQY